jgi:hypothetical protein
LRTAAAVFWEAKCGDTIVSVVGRNSIDVDVCIQQLPHAAQGLQDTRLTLVHLTHIALSNLGNLIHWIYVASLPVGPIWFLHGFFTVTTGLMLVCYVRYQRRTRFA